MGPSFRLACANTCEVLADEVDAKGIKMERVQGDGSARPEDLLNTPVRSRMSTAKFTRG